MGVRPNIQDPIELKGGELTVKGESDRPLPRLIQVVVVQDGGVAEGEGDVDVAVGGVERLSTGWSATLPGAGFRAGPAEALGIEIRVKPLEVTSWFQVVNIR